MSIATNNSDENHRVMIDSVCRGYSSRKHWTFFGQVLSQLPIRDICMLGVYFGRDIGYMDGIFKRLGRTDFTIVGVDKFADEYGDDWPAEIRDKTWNEAGFGPAPTVEAAAENLNKLGAMDRVMLVKSASQEFLATTDKMFDFIYIDTSHDYETTVQNIDLSIPRLRPNGWIGGDDYSDQGTWGVKRAVTERFPKHQIADGWIWVADHNSYVAPAR